MLLNFWETILNYLKEKPYWIKIQPIATIFSLYLIAVIMAYQYIKWEYNISTSLSLYLTSYIFKQITLIFLGIVILTIIFTRHFIFNGEEGAEENKIKKFLRQHGKIILHKLLTHHSVN